MPASQSNHPAAACNRADPRSSAVALAAWALLLVVASPADLLAQPAAELARLVPDEAGLCLVVNDLRGNTQKLLAAPWVKTLIASPLSQALKNSPEFEKFRRFNEQLKTHLQTDWPQLRDEILGQAVVFAYRPGPDSERDKEQGIILVRTTNVRLLNDLVERFQKLQKQSGELRELTPITYKGITYYRRTDDKSTTFYWLQDGVLALSPQENLIQSVIDRSQEKPASRFARQIEQAGMTEAFVALCVNPRAFDQEFDRKLEQADDRDRQVLTTFRRYWTAMDGVVLAWSQNSEISATFQGRVDALPASARQFFDQLAEPSDLWNRFPEQALVRFAARIDAAALLQMLGEFARPEDRDNAVAGLQKSLGAALGLDVIDDVLPNLGPDIGFYIAPASEAGKLPQALFALRAKPGSKQVDWNVMQTITLAARLAMFDYNSKHSNKVVMKTAPQEGVEVKHFVNDKGFPPGLEPALALKSGYLLIASNPLAVLTFPSGEITKKRPAGTPLLHVSFTRLAEELQQRRPEIVRHLTEQRNTPAQLVNVVIDSTIATLGAFDDLSLTHRTHAGQVTWLIRVRAK